MTAFLHDLRQGARQLIRRPGFSAAAIASLALGKPARAARDTLAVPEGSARGRAEDRGRTRADRDDLCQAAHGLPRDQRQGHGQCAAGVEHPVPSHARRLRQGGQRGAPRRRRPRAPDRVRQRSEHAARARRFPPARVGDSDGDRRQPGSHRPPASERRACPCGYRRRARLDHRLVGGTRACGVRHWRAANPGQLQRVTRRDGADVCAWAPRSPQQSCSASRPRGRRRNWSSCLRSRHRWRGIHGGA